MAKPRSAQGLIPCRVEQLSFGPWLVSLGSHHTLFLQLDYDRAAFAVNCGAIAAPKGWSGTVQELGPAWQQFDPETIRFCPDEYLSVGQFSIESSFELLKEERPWLSV
jgi:hypothetical protein